MTETFITYDLSCDSLSTHRETGIPVHYAGRRRTPQTRTGSVVARGTASGHTGGFRGRCAGRSLGECRIYLRKTPTPRDRPAGEIPAETARWNDGGRQITERSEACVLRRLGDARR